MGYLIDPGFCIFIRKLSKVLIQIYKLMMVMREVEARDHP